MNAGQFYDWPDVKAKFKPLRPKLPRKITAPLKVQPRSRRYMMVGTAFDYLLRFELQRLAPHAVCERLVAETAAGLLWRPGYFLYLTDPEERSPEEAEEIVTEHLVGGRPVERLRIADECLNTKSCPHRS